MNKATKAYLASQELKRLYNAYRATSKAHIWVVRNIGHNIKNDESIPNDEKIAAFRQLQEREALSIETDLVFKVRANQLQRRIAELESLS